MQKFEDTIFVKNSFEFKSTNETFVSKVIDTFNVKKATGVDKISVKLMKLGKISLLSPITKILNMSIDSCIFPNRLKEAQVTLLFKKNDPFLKSNYRPVSILPIHSTIFDKVLSVQLSDFFDNIFDNFPCALRKGHGSFKTFRRIEAGFRLQ